MEEWKFVIGSREKYAVSNHGRIKSFTREKEGVLLKVYNHRGKQLIVSFARKFFHKRCAIDRLIAEYFVPNPYNKRWIKHIDGNILNYRADNLEWYDFNKKNLRANLSEEIVMEIYKLAWERKLTYYEIAEKYKTTIYVIGEIKRGNHFSDIKTHRYVLLERKHKKETPKLNEIGRT